MKKWIRDLGKEEVIHAPTEEIAELLCKRFDELGLRWSTGDSYLHYSEYGEYGERTCYCPFSGCYDERGWYKEKGYTILTIDNLLDFEDTFCTPGDRRVTPYRVNPYIGKGAVLSYNGSGYVLEGFYGAGEQYMLYPEVVRGWGKYAATLPEINGHKGHLDNQMLKYGCAEIPIAIFDTSGNRIIKKLTLSSGVEINEEQIREIYTYLKTK